MILLTLLAQAQTGSPGGGASSGGGFNLFVPLIFFLIIFYFILIRPQSQRQKQQQQLINALKTGDRVVTSSGIHGLIANVKDSTVIVKVADNVKIEMEKSAIASVAKSAE
jgi:preprotein translocase subunit YajC